MKKISFKILAYLMLLIVGVSLFIGYDVPTKAAESDYTKKVVSVVYDNSGSMKTEFKEEYACYSLQILIGLLEAQDELIITPLNTSTGAVPQKNQSIIVDLSNSNREKVIRDAISKVAIQKNQSFGTPPGALDVALEHLVDRGLKTNAESGDEDEGVEYWFVILSDGVFTGYSNSEQVASLLEKKIKNYSFLNTIFYSFGTGAPDITTTDVVKNYAVTAYHASNAEQITEQMKEVANKLTRRFSVEAPSNILGTNVVKLNIEDYNLAMKSICVTAQDSGATLKSIKYNGNDISNITKTLTLDSVKIKFDPNREGVILVDQGCLVTVRPTTPWDSGILELEFDVPINQLDVMIEPAVYIEPYFQVQTNQGLIDVDMQYINSNLIPGQKIKVQYKVYDQLSNKEISPEKVKDVLGETETKITYCGHKYSVGEFITLEKGKNPLALDVKFVKNNFSIFASMMCVIEEDPTHYRIESSKFTNIDNDITKNRIEYNIYSENKKLSTKEEVLKYSIIFTITDPSGKEITPDYTVNDDGTIVLNVKTNTMTFGNYEIICKVVSPEKISRTDKQQMNVMPKDFEVNVINQGKLTISEHLLADNKIPVEFVVTSFGSELYIDGTVFWYKLEVDGFDVTNKSEIIDGKIVFVPTDETLPNTAVGSKTIVITVSNNELGSKTASYEMEIEKTSYTVETLKTENENINIYDLKNCKAMARFTITRNGTPLPYEEVKQLYENGEVDIKLKSCFFRFILPYGFEYSVEDVNGQGVIVCKVVCDMFSPLDNLMAAFMSTKQRTIEVSYKNTSNTEVFDFNPVTVPSRLIRVFIILVIIALIIHIIAYVAGFFVITKFSRGTIVTVTCGKTRTSFSTLALNLSKKNVVKWHLKRLLPFCALKPQKPVEEGTFGTFLIHNKEMLFKAYDNLDIYTVSMSRTSDTSNKIQNFIEELKQATNDVEAESLSLSKIPTDDVISCLRPTNKTIDSENDDYAVVPTIDGNVYVSVRKKKNGDIKIEGFVFFVYSEN